MNDSNTTLNNEQMTEENYICTAIPFELGRMVMTQSVSSLIDENRGANLSLLILLQRHKNGDWGTVPIEDKISNDEATREEGRVMSSYKLCGEKIWIITEWDRSVTTVLFPIEY